MQFSIDDDQALKPEIAGNVGICVQDDHQCVRAIVAAVVNSWQLKPW
jgi:hypothetical protein